jgi:hypothetical protein
MVLCGMLALWIAHTTSGGTAPAAVPQGLFALGALPWLVAAGVTGLTAVVVKLRLVEHHVATHGSEPSYQRIWLRLRRTLKLAELRNALVISSVLYTCWICFMYLLPVLLTEPAIVADAGVFQAVLRDYYWFYLAMGTSRFLGPYLSNRIQLSGHQARRFRAWGVLNCGALAIAGLALLLRGDGSARRAGLVPLALVVFWIAKVAEEAFKPVRSAYLNDLIVNGSDRAFVLSMATPFGAVLVVAGVGVLAAARHFVAALDEVQFSVPLLFSILGALGVVLTIRLSRRRRFSP